MRCLLPHIRRRPGNNYESPSRGKGFTLIELLVVVSIIALLVSILLPSLQSAREQAKKIACASNLKQIGMGLHLYFSDFEDYFPPHRVVSGTNTLDTTNSLERLAPYMGVDWTEREMYDDWMQTTRTIKYNGCYVCPSDRNPSVGYNIAVSYGVGLALDKTQFGMGWGMAYMDARTEWMSGLNWSRKVSDVRRPSEALFASDAYWDYIMTHYGYDAYSPANLDYRHGKGAARGESNATSFPTDEESRKGASANSLWGDTHVETNPFPISPESLKYK